MRRIAVSGYYGFGNAGDEAILAAMIEGLRELVPDVRFTVISGDPACTARVHGVEAVPRADVAGVVRALAGSDLLLSGGGSLLQDVTSQRNIPYYLGLVALARALGKPVMLYAQGVGPVSGAAGRWLIRRVCNAVQQITVRDEESLAALREMGVVHPPVEVTADASLALEPAAGFEGREALRAEGADPDRRPLVGLALRSWREGADPAALARLADALVEDLGAQVCFVAMQSPEDEAMARAVLARMSRPGGVLLRGSDNPRELLALVGALDAVIGMRLHALIFAALTGVPLLGLSYDPKVDNFLRALGWEEALAVGQAPVERVVARVRSFLERRGELKDLLARRVAPLRERARRNNELAAGLLAHPSFHSSTS